MNNRLLLYDMYLRNEFKAGLFVIVALFFLVVSLFAIGREKQLFIKDVNYTTTFRDVKGLSSGAPIRLGGIVIGRVDEIEFAPNSQDPSIIVNLSINKKFTDRLREDSTTSIETHGLLGDRFLNISPGSFSPGSSKKILNPGAEIKSTDQGDVGQVFERVTKIVDKVDAVANDLTTISAKLSNEGIPKIVDAASEVSQILKDVRQGNGPLNSLVYGKDGKSILVVIEESVKSIKEVVAAVKEITLEVKNGSGLLHQIIYSDTEQTPPATVAQLRDAIGNIKNITDSLVQGNGTLGALLIDPSLYNGLVEITDGAKRSFLLRQVVRQSLAK